MTTVFETTAALVAELTVLKNHLDEYRAIESIDLMPPIFRQVILEYYRVAALNHRSEKDEARLDLILRAAEENEKLDFWLNEIDYLLAHEEGLLDQESYELYLNEHADFIKWLGLEDPNQPDIDSPPALPESRFKESLKDFIKKEIYHASARKARIIDRSMQVLKEPIRGSFYLRHPRHHKRRSMQAMQNNYSRVKAKDRFLPLDLMGELLTLLSHNEHYLDATNNIAPEVEKNSIIIYYPSQMLKTLPRGHYHFQWYTMQVVKTTARARVHLRS
jgi:hypothetical protein